MLKFKDFSRPLSVFRVLFKANLIFKRLFKTALYIQELSSLWEPCLDILDAAFHVNPDQTALGVGLCVGSLFGNGVLVTFLVLQSSC